MKIGGEIWNITAALLWFIVTVTALVFMHRDIYPEAAGEIISNSFTIILLIVSYWFGQKARER